MNEDDYQVDNKPAAAGASAVGSADYPRTLVDSNCFECGVRTLCCNKLVKPNKTLVFKSCAKGNVLPLEGRRRHRINHL
jgi:hypothetical protein